MKDSVIERGVLRVLGNIEPCGAVGERERGNCDANAVRDGFAERLVGMVEERGHALADALGRRGTKVPDDVAAQVKRKRMR